MDQVKWQDNERADTTDLNGIGTLADFAICRDTRLLAEPRQLAPATDKASIRGSVVYTSSVTFGVALKATFMQGLELCLSSRAALATYGDIYKLTADVDVPFAERGAPDDLYYLFMAKPGTLGDDSTSAGNRVFYDGTAVGNEVVQNVVTRRTRPLTWTHHLSTDAVAIAASEALGYQHVATLKNGIGPAPAFEAWHYLFPEITNTVDYPGDGVHPELTSAVHALAAIANELSRIKGTTFTWDEAIPAVFTLDQLRASIVNLNLITLDATIGNVNLDVRTAALEALTLAPVIGNVDLDERLTKMQRVRCAIGDLTFHIALTPTWIKGYNVFSLARTAPGVFKITFTSAISNMNSTAVFTQVYDAVISTWVLQWRFVVEVWDTTYLQFRTQYWDSGTSTWVDFDPADGFVASVTIFDAIP